MRNKQKGLSLISTIIVVGILAFCVFIGLRAAPVYGEFYAIKKIMKQVATAHTASSSRDEIRKAVALAMMGGYAANFSPNDIEISKDNGQLLLYTEYERVIPLFGNVSLLFKFDATSR